MGFSESVGKWVGLLEEAYGFGVDPVPATAAEIGELEDFWGLTIDGELRELLDFSNGFFVHSMSELLPGVSLTPVNEFVQRRNKKPDEFLAQASFENHPYLNTAPCELRDIVLLSDWTWDFGVVAAGPCQGAVWAFDGGGGDFEWVSPSLAALFDNCFWYLENGYIDVRTRNDLYYLRLAKPGRPKHPKLSDWTLLPYEAEYDGDATIKAWRW